METIKGAEKLKQYLSEEQLNKLQKAGQRYIEQYNTTFTIQSVTDQEITIETTQTENTSGKYATEATLIKRGQDLLIKLLPNHKIMVDAQPIFPSPTSVVDAKWIDQQMQQKGIRIKQIAFETGIDRDDISNWVTGKRSMGQIVKAMFFFYFSR
ncbi:helix-turn-helix transcriptional regulator [Pedobacter sp. KBS0701]|uniref:helix-turn-helix domain-containing protein n=1 Tax=Pedobacter sp. KBS0701 TaxID=2578106 RepID=UPI00110D2824|nr:helix-turn-helix transcriptional regulator [Pedobacter sp. KBS0701]QDW24152.1 helix-turn-helix transcriptional regulator [Pedobacter sp. KBS0701]